MIDEHAVFALRKAGKPAVLRCAGHQILFICLASLPFLFLCSGFTTSNTHEPSVPLAFEVSQADATECRRILTAKAISPIAYNAEQHLLLVPESQKRQAYVVLAQNGMLAQNTQTFGDLQSKPDFFANALQNEQQNRDQRQNEVAKILSTMAEIRSAQVAYSAPERKPFFRVPAKKYGVVEVTTRWEKPLEPQTVAAIFRLVAFFQPGLNLHSILLHDQNRQYDMPRDVMTVQERTANPLGAGLKIVPSHRE